MSRFARVSRSAALVVALAIGGTGVGASASPDPTGSAAPITSLPFTTTTRHDGPLTAGTGAGDLVIAEACNGGAPVFAPARFSWTSAEAGHVVAFASDRIEPGATSTAGVAVVSPAGDVLDCGSAPDADTRAQAGPLAVGAGQTVHVVSYIAEPGDDADLLGAAVGLHVADTAAPPPNDDPAAATPIPSLPFTDTVDTTLATVRADDPSLPGCDTDGVTGTVWWSWTPSATGEVAVDVDRGRALLVRDTGDGPEVVAGDCSGSGFTTTVQAGERYLIYVYDQGSAYYPPLVPGGVVTLTVDRPGGATPSVDVAVDGTGTVRHRTGAATITGTATCDVPGAPEVLVRGTLRQERGRSVRTATLLASAACDGTAAEWSTTVRPAAGRFTAGRAEVRVVAEACDRSGCTTDAADAVVRLRPAR